jgi:hypothetical protein
MKSGLIVPLRQKKQKNVGTRYNFSKIEIRSLRAPPPKNIEPVIYEYVDREKVLYFVH